VAPAEAPAPVEAANYFDADEPAAYAAPYSSPGTKPLRRDSSKLPVFAIIGPLGGIAAVVVGIFVFNANNDSTESPVQHKPSHEQLAKSEPQKPPPHAQPIVAHPVTTTPRIHPTRIPGAKTPSGIPPDDMTLPNQFHPAEAMVSWFSNSARDEFSSPFDNVADMGGHWWSSVPKPSVNRWMPGEVAVSPAKLTFDQDETKLEVPIGSVSASARLQIVAWMDGVAPARQLVLQDKPEQIAVTFEVDHEKPGYAVVRIKPWLGNIASGVPCSLKRLHAMTDTLPGQLQNAKANYESVGGQIQSAEQNLRNIMSQSHSDAIGQTAQQVAIRDAKNRLTSLHARQNALSRSGERWTAQLQELPTLIQTVEGFVGKTAQFQIYYTLDGREIIVASTADQPDTTAKSNASASLKP
jgi:hypothetical protein